MNYQENLIEDSARIYELLRSVRLVAILGIKTQAQADQPAYYVPEALQRMGLEIIPAPVYYPEATEILGQKVYRKLVDIPGTIDLVDVFRRPSDIPQHLDDLLAKKPGIVWFQTGIRNEEAARKLAEAGIKVVQDRCLMVDYGRVAGQ